MLQGAARLVAVSPYVRDNALAAWPGKVDVVPPGVDTEAFSPRGEAEAASILFVGPLSSRYRWKGLDVLLAALPHVRSRVPQARLRLVGDGDRRAELEARAARDGGVDVLGRQGASALAALYAQSTVTVLPSQTDAESFGMVLAEANACGRPVVGSRVGGIPDFVRDGDNGLLAWPGDARDLAERILDVLEDPAEARAMGMRGRRRVMRDHDWGRLTRSVEAILEEAAGRRTPRDGWGLDDAPRTASVAPGPSSPRGRPRRPRTPRRSAAAPP
jgi:glycosyltransferase involved in cell wall biosynthesis